MGDRYLLTVECICGHVDNDVYYAPTCEFLEWRCPKCRGETNLEEYTGISYGDASNCEEIDILVRALVGRHAG